MMKKVSAFALASLIIVTPIFSSALTKNPDAGELAYKHVVELSDEIGDRTQATNGEYDAKDYIEDVFMDLGYDTKLQSFEIQRTKDDKPYDTVTSYNVIAVKPGESKKEIIIGAHYDSKNNTGKGADDNASGVAVMLETAEKISDLKTPYTVRFIAFGAEESFKNSDNVKNGGLNGSSYYAENMTQAEVNNTVAMINLDSLLAGDFMYVYGDLGKKGFVREQALAIAKELGLDLETNPGHNKDYPAGTTGDWSDHAPFVERGIPYGYFEATNWHLGDMDGYTQTEKHGEIWHTENDNLDFLEREFPGRVEERLMTFSNTLTELVLNFNPAEYNSVKIKIGKDEIKNNGKPEKAAKKPFIKEGRALVSLDVIEKAMKLEVSVSNNEKELTLSKNGKTVVFDLDTEKTYDKDSKAVITEDGDIFVAVNEIAKVLNGNVKWDAKDKSVEIVY